MLIECSSVTLKRTTLIRWPKGKNDALEVHATESLSQYSLGSTVVVAARLPDSSIASVMIRAFHRAGVR